MAAAQLTPGQFDLVYNMLSLGLASMAASTVFFFLRLGSFSERYKAALCFTGLVTFIAMYHYFRIFDSFVAAYTPCEVTDGEVNHAKCSPELYNYTATGIPFNDAYRYVDWLLTVPLLLIEIVLVMKLSEAETFSRCVTLGVSSALMIANGYPGEITGDPMQRWVFWFLSMLPFTYIVYTLFVGLKASQDSQPEAVRDQVRWACWATVFSWCTYPIVFVLPMLGGSSDGKAGLSSTAMVGIQVGYTFSDIISKCGVGYLVYRIGLAKSMIDHSNGKAGFNMDEVEALAQDEEEA
jgi:bacteriorhodopsin